MSGETESLPLAERLERQIAKLVNYEGPATLTVARNGKISVGNATLKKVEPKSHYIQFENGDASLSLLGDGSLPLLGTGIAIKKITNQNGDTIYENPEVDERYSIDTSIEVREKCGFEDG